MKRISLLFLMGLILMSFNSDDPSSYLSFNKTTHDFGSITQGIPVQAKFILSNTGDQPIIINSVDRQCGCTTPEFSSLPITKNQKDTINVGYNAASLGAFTKKLTVKTNLGNIELFIRGTVIK